MVPATTEIYTLSLHDALPIYPSARDAEARLRARAGGGHRQALPAHRRSRGQGPPRGLHGGERDVGARHPARSEEHTSELQSHSDLVCRLLLEKKKKN